MEQVIRQHDKLRLQRETTLPLSEDNPRRTMNPKPYSPATERRREVANQLKPHRGGRRVKEKKDEVDAERTGTD